MGKRIRDIMSKYKAEASVTLVDNAIYLDGEVMRGGVSSSAVNSALISIGSGDISLWINSPGGDCADGIAIYNLLKAYQARGNKIDVYIYGYACSIASVIALAGDRIKMFRGSLMMIHDPWACVVGNASELREEASVLDLIKTQMIQAYKLRTKKSEEDISEILSRETWYDVDEAIKAGLIDEEVKESDLIGEDVEKDSDIVKRRGSVRDLEEILRNLGYSRTQAKIAASAAFKAIDPIKGQRDVGSDPVEMTDDQERELREAIKARSNYFK